MWGGGGPLTWQPLAHNLNVSFNIYTNLNIFIYLTANLADNLKILKLIVSIETVEGPVTTGAGGRGEGLAISRPSLMSPKLPGSI